MTKSQQEHLADLARRLEHAERVNRSMARDIVRLSHNTQFLLDELRRLSPEWWEKWNQGEITAPPFEV